MKASLVPVSLLLAAVACDGGTTDPNAVAPAPGPEAPADPSKTPAGPPLYLVATAVFKPEGTQMFLVTVPNLDAGTQPDYDRSVTIERFTPLFGESGKTTFYTGSEDTPEITRWQLEGDRLVQGPRVSFANQGLKNTNYYPGYVRFASPTKAYVFDAPSSSVIIWNPADMTVTGEIKLDLAPLSGDRKPYFGDEIVQRKDGKLLAGVYWYGDNQQGGGDFVRVYTIDPATDTVTRDDDTRCGDNYSSSLASDGTAYYSGGASSVITRERLGAGFGATPCLLRIVPPGGTFDDAYAIDPRTLTGGRPSGEVILVDDRTAFLRAFDASLAPAFDGDIRKYIDAPAYSWWRWTIGEPQATLVPNQTPGTSGGLRFRVDDRQLVTVSSQDFSTTTLTELSATKGVVPQITLRGYPYGVLRLR